MHRSLARMSLVERREQGDLPAEDMKPAKAKVTGYNTGNKVEKPQPLPDLTKVDRLEERALIGSKPCALREIFWIRPRGSTVVSAT